VNNNNKIINEMKLATVERIDKVLPHLNADRLDLVFILGFQCISEKGLYNDGDIIVFIQPDTSLPKDKPWAEGYLKYVGSRVKAINLRGMWSEGIIVPFHLLGDIMSNKTVGDDVSDLIGVTKYIPPKIEEFDAIGALPYSMPKTDEERYENFSSLPLGELVDLTLKIDGMSTTIYYNIKDDKYGVTGRIYDVNHSKFNRYTKHQDKVKEKIIIFCKKQNKSLAFRFETYGDNIQGTSKNIYAKKEGSIACFEVYDLETREKYNKGSEYYFLDVCESLEIETVPIIERDVILTNDLIKKYSLDIKTLENGDTFEGIVVKHPKMTFKIMNKYYDSQK
jgi:RNA ligase (TIGR02306 family)